MMTEMGESHYEEPGRRQTCPPSSLTDSGKDRTESPFPFCREWCLGWRRRSTRGRAAFGVLLILIGLLWLGRATGWLPQIWFGPLVIVMVGIWIVGRNLLKRKPEPDRSE